jgi:hypothetical protein
VTIDGTHYRDQAYLTFTKLDAKGQSLWLRDARRNLVLQYISPPKPTQRRLSRPEPHRSNAHDERTLLRLDRQSASPAQHGRWQSMGAM